MSWDLETSDEFVVWYEGLNDAEVESVNFSVDLLEKAGRFWEGRMSTL